MATGLSPLLQHYLLLCMLVLTRLSLMLASTPALGAGVPKRVRAFFAIALTVLIVPLMNHVDTTDIRTMVDMGAALAREALIGLLMGMVIQLLISGLQIAGELANSTGGLQLGDSYDAQLRANVPVFSKLVGMLSVTVLLISGGHRELLDALLGSFATMPPGELNLNSNILDLLVHELSGGLIAGIRAAAPLLAAVLLANLLTGLISRTLPQLNLLAIGLNVNAITVLLVAFICIVAVGTVFEDELKRTLTDIRIWIQDS